MARDKKPLDETPEEEQIRRNKEVVAFAATRNEKVSFDRKMTNMVTLLTKLKPIEDEITDLLAKKIPIMDEIQELRNEMVTSCVHPITHLVDHGEHIVCKFCNRKFTIPSN
jgi:hypothetical protein